MVRKNLKIFIFFLAVFVTLSFNSVVRAEIEIDENGTPGVGGKDPCYEYSYVCIVNYAAVRVTYYDAAQRKTKTIDFFDDDYSPSGLKKLPKKKLAARFGWSVEGRKQVDLGRVSQTFSSKKAQEFYSNVWSELTDHNSDVFTSIIKNFIDKNSVNNFETYAKNHQDDYIIVEPLYRLKIQKYEDAKKAYRNKTKGTWEYFYGTATKIAKKVTSYYDSCRQQGGGLEECEKIYKSRKEKGHVSRIANNLRLEKIIKVNGKTINKVSKAVKNKTKMSDVAHDSKGYGIAAISVGSIPKPEEENNRPTCYSYTETSTPASCIESNENYKRGTKEISANIGVESVPSDGTCENDAKNNNGSKKSDSKYGRRTSTIISGTETGDYCAVYCESQENITVNTPVINGMKQIGAYPASETSSTEYYENFKIEYEQTYNCRVDFTKAYNVDIFDSSDGNKSWMFTAIGDKNYSTAQAELYELVEEYSQCMTTAESLGGGCENKKAKLNKKINEINAAYSACAIGEIAPSTFGKSIDDPKLKIGEQEITLEAQDVLDSGDTCVGCKSNITRVDIIKKVDGTDASAEIQKLSNQLKELMTKVASRQAITYKSQKVYEMENRAKYNFNTDERSDGDYGGFYDDDLGNNRICEAKGNSLTGNQVSVTGLGTLAQNGQLMCIGDEVNYSPTNIVTECPANTYHAGTNAYYWLANGLIKDVKKALSGYNSATAIETFCNDQDLSKFDGGYEPILNEKGDSVIDGCLAAGFDLKYCNDHSETHYTCTDGKDKETQIDELVYQEAVKQNDGKTEGIGDGELDSALEIVKETHHACTNACYENNKPKDFVYRTISLDSTRDAFPGLEGDGRLPGSNWNNAALIQKVITDKKDVYTKDPIYIIELTPSKTKEIRNYNKRNKYDDFKLDCNENGAFCISEFLNKGWLGVTGECSNISVVYDDDFQDQKNSFENCLN